MITIPSLTQALLELLRTAKKYSGKTVRICYETPITDPRKPPIKTPPFIQKLVDCGLIEVESKQVLSGPSLFERDSWYEYCADLELPSIRAWKLWRKEFIASQQEAPHVLLPGEGFEEFSDVWIQEINFHATQPQ
ncbi:hypothetical protein [Acaryochloris marina]|uniref:Uncharacterized protein n=1 Tax=Acaryochloris marina (strain MBIC 11017) TaxID=329726 RepID=A8ZN22_ACAM1|nr:hypothetical protein [Acaryochloris marina]ABW32221.1 hypothetical protein AM1_C0291 [Acaryochloris marina MBIC11017]